MFNYFHISRYTIYLGLLISEVYWIIFYFFFFSFFLLGWKDGKEVKRSIWYLILGDCE